MPTARPTISRNSAATTADMVAKRDVRAMSVVAFNAKGH